MVTAKTIGAMALNSFHISLPHIVIAFITIPWCMGRSVTKWLLYVGFDGI